jgi:hypothetical protein
LGNALWELASTVGLARRHGMEPRFPTDWNYRHIFSVPDEYFADVSGIESPTLATDLKPEARSYLQNLAYFADIADEIREMFAPSPYASAVVDAVEGFAALPQPVLSVHVRRGDNVQVNDPWTPNKHLYHPLRPLSYYQSAIAEMWWKVWPERPSTAVFSDDREWCQANIPADYYGEAVVMPKENELSYYTTSPMDWVDLFLMARCDLHVISNSSFAWWGAWLSDDPSPLYPANFFGPLVSCTTDSRLMFEPTWREWPCEIEDPEC